MISIRKNKVEIVLSFFSDLVKMRCRKNHNFYRSY